MRVVIDQLKCNTIGICVKEAPDIFQFLPGLIILAEVPFLDANTNLAHA